MVDAFIDETDAFGAGIPLLPPGCCTEARHSALQAQVHPLCDAAQRTCDGLTGCHSVSQRMLRNALCIGARARVNRECFDGGNWAATGVRGRGAMRCASTIYDSRQSGQGIEVVDSLRLCGFGPLDHQPHPAALAVAASRSRFPWTKPAGAREAAPPITPG